MKTELADPAAFGLHREVVDQTSYDNAVDRFAQDGIVLPTIAQLAEPATIPDSVEAALAGVDRNAPHPLNLFRVHWYNDLAGRRVALPEHVVLTREFTGVDAPIIVALGNRFPMIGAHKVLPAYTCLVARVVTGQFDPTRQRAIWPSTGNYARGGVAISRIMDCRGVAVLPENMSRERFDWLDAWVADPSDIIRTPGSESNVKEIYDKCAELSADPANVVFNQFSEFANHVGHYEVTGRALEAIFESYRSSNPEARAAAYVSASGSAGTLGAGDWLKERHDARIVAVEALECPTMLYNGFGEHNIQGIGDKHIPLIHNVMNTDVVVGVSDVATDALIMAFNSEAGHDRLRSYGVADEVIANLKHLGLSSICNVLAAIKVAKRLDLGPDDVMLTVATDGSELYDSERERFLAERYDGDFSALDAAGTLDRHLFGADVDHVAELDHIARSRIFNLAYFTWVEQQGIELDDFEARRHEGFWNQLHAMTPVWDEMILEFNARTGVSG